MVAHYILPILSIPSPFLFSPPVQERKENQRQENRGKQVVVVVVVVVVHCVTRGTLFLDKNSKNSNTFPGAAERKGIWHLGQDDVLPGRVVALVSSPPGNTSSG